MLNEQQQRAFESLFNLFDKNGNGSIDKADFMAAFDKLKEGASPQQIDKIDTAARRWFMSLYLGGDENKDKKVSKEEWLKWAATLPTQLATESAYPRSINRFVDVVFDTISSDNEVITAQEYTAWFTLFGLTGDAAVCFQKLDDGNNGKISFKDFYELMKEFVSGDTTKAGTVLFGNF
jgi:Ca2+-binding EF-hand superfamily protein